MEPHNKDELLFAQLILMFQAAAMQQMGKLMNPASNTIERELEQAQISIDMLEMIHKKTQKNLSPDEDRLLSDILRELRLIGTRAGALDPAVRAKLDSFDNRLS